jgi:hypothetical protein
LSAKISRYILTIEPDCCPDCERLDGTEFGEARLKEFQAILDACPKGCAREIVAVYDDEGKVTTDD